MSYPALEGLLVDVSDLTFGATLGHGSFSIVQEALMRPSCSRVAIKTYDKQTLKKHKKTEEALMERHLLSRINHPNIVRLISSLSSPTKFYLITELCVKGELWQLCRGWGHPEDLVKIFVIQVCRAMQYIHRAGIVHRDIKAENIFVSHDMTVKLGDFGTAKDVFNPSMKASTTPSFRAEFEHFVGTPNFMAPEVVANQVNDALSDIWSLGCTVYQILLGIPPFVASSQYFIFLRIEHRDVVFPSDGISQSARNFVMDMLRPRKSRISLQAILEHPYIKMKPRSNVAYSLNENLIMKTFQSASDEELVEKFQAASFDNLDTCITNRVYWADEWRRKSKPGTGAAALLHLNLPELSEDYAYLASNCKI